MTTKELYQLNTQFRASAMMLSGVLHRMQKAILDIEEKAQLNEGELTPQEARRHQKLKEIFDKTYEQIGDVLSKFP